MSRHYAFLGFGELGRQIAGLFLTPEERAQAVVFDDLQFAAGAAGSRPFADYASNQYNRHAWIVALGYKHLALKCRLIAELVNTNRDVPVMIHERAHVHGSARLGGGVVVYPMANVDQGVAVGAGTLLNNSVVVSHDTQIGNGCFLSPGVVVAGGVQIGARSFLGAGSIVANNVSIGEDAVIGIGSVITRDVPAGASAIGNPARILDRPLVLT